MKNKTINLTFTMSAQPDLERISEAGEEAALLLEQIAQQMREGFTSGYHPSWDLSISEE